MFEDKTNFLNDEQYEFPYCIESDDPIIPDTIDILMDAVYCINTAIVNPILYNMYIPLKENTHLISELNEDKEIHKFPEIIFGTNINYIALYTELIKSYVNEIKYVISSLFHLYNYTEKIDKDLVKDFLVEIKEMYSFELSKLILGDSRTIKKDISSLCNFIKFIDTEKCFYNEIDFSKFDTFILLLKRYRGNFGKANFIDGRNCFCLVQTDLKYYFSLSGYDYKINKKNNNIYKELEKNLNDFFSDSTFQLCQIGDDMLSYGNEIKNDELIKFSSPKKFCEQKNIGDDNLRSQYSCCERKIFPYIKDKSKSMYIYCKYEPCVRCIPAIEDMKKQYGKNFMYFAFIKNAKTFSCYLKEKKKNLPKEEDYIYT
ncbi:MAG: hypothetical protein UH788_04890, partial [Treponemataceae bacterium]|nr:hypothetical protein [Treponemataceae bacterium]